MIKKLLVTVFCFVCLMEANAQSCMGGIRYRYTTLVQTVWFQDSSSTNIVNPVKEYVHWDFGDGTTDTANGLVHHFPSAAMYWVKKEVKYSETGNAANNCVRLDSVLIDASVTSPNPPPCILSRGSRLQWLSGLTYGYSSYYDGCTPSIYEIVVDTGLSVTSGQGPMNGIYTSHSDYFTYTLPAAGDYTVTMHIVLPPPAAGIETYIRTIYADSIPSTPSNCHASFFLSRDSVDINSWTAYNYSSSSGTPAYLWDFGDGTSSTAVNPVHSYSTAGNYTICLTVSNGTCSDTYCNTAFFDPSEPGAGISELRAVNMSVGIGEAHVQEGFTISPNPADYELNIHFADVLNNNMMVRVYDDLGRELRFQNAEKGSEGITLDLGLFNPGIYMISATDGKHSFSKKFIKK